MKISEEIFYLRTDTQISLQQQIQRMVSRAILNGQIFPDEKMPSSRLLAKHLKVARLTVTLAYHELVADGYLSTRPRSGFYVANDAPLAPSFKDTLTATNDVSVSHKWVRNYQTPNNTKKPRNWQNYPYPFIYGQPDSRLFNHAAWRSCAHKSLGTKEFGTLSNDYISEDDPELIRYIASQTLPRRGVNATPNQILVTIGAQNALFMIAHLLIGKNTQYAFENPGYTGLHNILMSTSGNPNAINVGQDGMVIDDLPKGMDLVFTTPSHHAPTTATMSIGQRKKLLTMAEERDFLIVEDDYEFEMSFYKSPTPALKSLDERGRVIYIGSFSKSIFPGLRLGYVVASQEIIQHLHNLRAAMFRHPPGHVQRTTAHFLALGYYDSTVKRMRNSYIKRRAVIDDCLKEMPLIQAYSADFGGSSIWIKGPDALDADLLAEILIEKGVLIEPGSSFFWQDKKSKNFFRLAYSSISENDIKKGMEILYETLQEVLSN